MSMTVLTIRKCKKLYPKLWAHVYGLVKNDLSHQLATYPTVNLSADDVERIAHNAAFSACDAHHWGIE